MVATSTVSARRQAYKEELRRHILETARRLFVRDGYEGFSLRKLASEVGYSPAALYLHFKNKQEIFRCLVAESFETLLKTTPSPEEVAPGDPVAQIKLGMRRYVNFGLEHPDHYRLAFLVPNQGVSTAEEAAAAPRTNAAFAALRARLERCIASGRMQPGSVDLIAQAIWAACHGVTSLLIQRPQFPWVEHEQLIQRVIDSAVDSLLCAPEQSPAKGSRGGRNGKC